MNKEKEEYYDSYGFRTQASKLAIQNYLHDPQKDQQRIQTWQSILQNQNFTQQKQLIKSQVRKGIPDKLRPQVWMKLIKPPLKQYESILVKQELKQIDRDVNRTLPSNKRQKQLRERLRNMLNVIAVAFPEMGYCQGLNFITANLLLILNDKQTYNVMYHILLWNGHEELMTDLDRIYIKLYTLNKLVKKHYPKLSKCLQKMEIDLMLYASSWFITLYTNTLPCQYIFRILEIYLVEGEKILYRVALQILKEKKKFIKNMNSIQDVNEQMKNIDDFDVGKIDIFFREMFEINLSRKEIENYENQYIQIIKKKKEQEKDNEKKSNEN